MYQHLGDGAAAEAKKRCSSAIEGLREIIKNKLADEKFVSAHAFLGQLLDDANAWESDFVKAARHHALAVYKPPLSAANELWAKTENKYGMGLNYREEVVAELEKWFDKNETLHEELEQLIRRAWRASVLKPLQNASGTASASQESVQ